MLAVNASVGPACFLDATGAELIFKVKNLIATDGFQCEMSWRIRKNRLTGQTGRARFFQVIGNRDTRLCVCGLGSLLGGV